MSMEHSSEDELDEKIGRPDAGLTQEEAMNELTDLDKAGMAAVEENIPRLIAELRRDADAVEAAYRAMQHGAMSPEEAYRALLYECSVIAGDEFDCHHRPVNVEDDECKDCFEEIPRIPGFEGGRRE